MGLERTRTDGGENQLLFFAASAVVKKWDSVANDVSEEADEVCVACTINPGNIYYDDRAATLLTKLELGQEILMFPYDATEDFSARMLDILMILL